MPKGHVHLNPLPPKKKRLFWASVIIAVVLVGIGWIISIRAALSPDFAQIRQGFDESIHDIAEQVKPVGEEAGGQVSENLQEFSEAVEEAQAAYEDTQQTEAN